MDALTVKALAKAAPYTKSPSRRLEGMADALYHIDGLGIPGDVVECGVWRGGNIVLARLLSPRRRCWLYDTFTGMPPAGALDIRRDGGGGLLEGKAAASIAEVRQSFERTSTWDPDLLHFVKGRVEDTLCVPANIPDQIALLRLDTDYYTSTKLELRMLWPRLVKKGILIIDDYGHWLGARKAVDEFFRGGFGRYQPLEIDYSAIRLVKG